MLTYRKLAITSMTLAALGGASAVYADEPAAPAMPMPAAPAAAAAPAAPAGPTLAKVLEASGITESGYIDAAYSYSTKSTGTTTAPLADRVFDVQNDSSALVLHQAAIQLAKQPKEGFGGLVNLTFGADVPVFASYPNNGKSSQFDVTQAYGQYASGAYTLIFGKFTTLQGSEVIWAPSNNNFSRSILFGAIPFTHTGARLTYALDDTTNLIIGVNNGWDQITASTGGKTVELGATLNPIKPLNITISDYVGPASAGATGSLPTGERNSFNIVATYAASDMLTLGVEYLNVQQSNAATVAADGADKAKYNGYALYGTYMFTPAWRLALRAELLDDKDGYHFGVSGTKYSEVTATLSYLASDSFEVRGEVRGDHATNTAFAGLGGSSAAQSLTTAAIEALYKF